MSSCRYIQRFALAWSGVFVAVVLGCSPSPTTEDPATATTESESTFTTCGPCPAGSYPTGFFCDPVRCGNTCVPGNGTNASSCVTPPDCGSFNKCGVTCPSGFFVSQLICDTLNCGNTCLPGQSNNAASCTNIAMPTCCKTCSGFPVGGTNDRGASGGQHFVELYWTSFTSSNPSVGTASEAACTCTRSFTFNQIICNGVATPVVRTFASTTQVNIALPTSPVPRTCTAHTSSTNTQYIQFNFTTPAD